MWGGERGKGGEVVGVGWRGWGRRAEERRTTDGAEKARGWGEREHIRMEGRGRCVKESGNRRRKGGERERKKGNRRHRELGKMQMLHNDYLRTESPAGSK